LALTVWIVGTDGKRRLRLHIGCGIISPVHTNESVFAKELCFIHLKQIRIFPKVAISLKKNIQNQRMWQSTSDICLFKQIGFYARIGMAWRAYADMLTIPPPRFPYRVLTRGDTRRPWRKRWHLLKNSEGK